MKKIFYGLFAITSTVFASCSKDGSTTPGVTTPYITVRSTDGRTAQLDTDLNGPSIKLGDTSWAYSVASVERTSAGTTNYMLFTTPGNTAFHNGIVFKTKQTDRVDSSYNLVFEGVSYSN